jgi:hypothetical protein
MSKEAQLQDTVSITPIKQRRGKQRNDETSTDQQLDAYKVWLLKIKEEDPEIGTLIFCIS